MGIDPFWDNLQTLTSTEEFKMVKSKHETLNLKKNIYQHIIPWFMATSVGRHSEE